MKTRITLWLEKGKPTRVRTTKSEDYWMEDLSDVFGAKNKSDPPDMKKAFESMGEAEEADNVDRQGKSD